MLDKYISMDVPTISSLQKEIETLRETIKLQGEEVRAQHRSKNEWKRRYEELAAEMDAIDK